MAKLLRRLLWPVLGAGVLSLLVWGFWPVPIEVNTTVATVGSLAVTVEEDGVTRIREKYTVSSPVTGKLMRIQLHPGDEVVKGETVLATVTPADPVLLDARAKREAQARVNAAEALVLQAQAVYQRAGNQREIARHTFDRIKIATSKGAVTQQDFDEAEHNLRIAEADLRAAESGLDVAGFELDLAKAALRYVEADDDEPPDAGLLEIVAPTSGKILRVMQESTAVINPGTEIIEIGDPAELELVVDVLSDDAISIKPGAEVVIEQWGGNHDLNGIVRLVEPSAFLKVSALGIEEQRVNVVVDFISPLEDRVRLGDGFRVEAKIITEKTDEVLKVHQGALVRENEQWFVFQVIEGRARRIQVELGNWSATEVQVLNGISAGDVLVLYPSDRIVDDARIHDRKNN